MTNSTGLTNDQAIRVSAQKDGATSLAAYTFGAGTLNSRLLKL